VVIGGRLHRGHHWYAGEISRMTLDYREWQIDFGDSGYLESRISATAIPEWEHARAVLERAGDDREAAMRRIVDAAGAGDVEARAVFDELAVFLGSAVANIVAVLDPEIVVLGGGLSHAGELLLEPVGRVVSRIVPNVPCLAISALGDEAQLMGSLCSAMEIAEARLFAIAARPAQRDLLAEAGGVAAGPAGRTAAAARRSKPAHR
jgi:glucokinase